MDSREVQTWKIHLDESVATRLRNAVNRDSYIAIRGQKTLKGKNNREYPSWNRTCALMDRIGDIANHINDMVVKRDPHARCAFDFLDLLNHSAVLVDCIFEIARIFTVDMTDYQTSTEIFNMNGPDKNYYEYLRSLCSIHPIETSRHKSFQSGEFECCPYVGWNDASYNEPGDLIAQKYLNKPGWDHYQSQPIYMNEVIRYIEKMYMAIESKIIPGIEEYQEKFRNKFRSLPMKTETDFSRYTDYLKYLADEGDLRLGCDKEYYIQEVCRFFEVEFERPRNKRVLTKYQNALRRAIGFHHTCLQNVSYDGWENTGIVYPCVTYETTLLDLLLSLDSHGKLANMYSYGLSKAYELVDSHSCPYYAVCVLSAVKPFLDRYVDLEEATTNEKYYVLVRLALYADCLRNKNMLNQNLPNELAYRFRRLTAPGWERLHKETRRKGKDYSLEELAKLLEYYGERKPSGK